MKRLSVFLGTSIVLSNLWSCQSAPPSAEICPSYVWGPRENRVKEELLARLSDAGVPYDFARSQMCELTATTHLTPATQAVFIEATVREGTANVRETMKIVSQAARDLYVQMSRKSRPRMIAGGDEDFFDANALALIAVSTDTLRPSPEVRRLFILDVYLHPLTYGFDIGSPGSPLAAPPLAKSTLAPFLSDVRSFMGANHPSQAFLDTFGR